MNRVPFEERLEQFRQREFKRMLKSIERRRLQERRTLRQKKQEERRAAATGGG